MKEKRVIVYTERKTYVIDFRKLHWWNRWHISRISDNISPSGNIIKQIIQKD